MTEDKKEERRPKRKLTPVKVVAQEGKSALVEWTTKDDVRRAYVPLKEIEGDKCPEDVLGAGIPYGAPWEELIDLSGLTPEAVAKQLRRQGVWTSADVGRNMQGVQRVINRATGLTPASLHTLASQYEAEEA